MAYGGVVRDPIGWKILFSLFILKKSILNHSAIMKTMEEYDLLK
jgi:hypothetical protein